MTNRRVTRVMCSISILCGFEALLRRTRPLCHAHAFVYFCEDTYACAFMYLHVRMFVVQGFSVREHQEPADEDLESLLDKYENENGYALHVSGRRAYCLRLPRVNCYEYAVACICMCVWQ